MGALVRRLSARNGPIGPVVTLSLAPEVAAGFGRRARFEPISARGLTPASWLTRWTRGCAPAARPGRVGFRHRVRALVPLGGVGPDGPFP